VLRRLFAADIGFVDFDDTGQFVGSLPQASRRRWSMNQAVFCVTPICLREVGGC
jgi:hypothetical protein